LYKSQPFLRPPGVLPAPCPLAYRRGLR